MYWKSPRSSYICEQQAPATLTTCTAACINARPWADHTCYAISHRLHFVININPIRLSSSLLHFISYYLSAPIVSLFIVSSAKLVCPSESLYYRERRDQFFHCFVRKMSQTQVNFRNSFCTVLPLPHWSSLAIPQNLRKSATWSLLQTQIQTKCPIALS